MRSGSASGKHGLRVDEAEPVTPRVTDVERALAPWSGDDVAGRIAVDGTDRDAVEPLRALGPRGDVVAREVDVVGIRLGLHACGRWIEERQSDVAAVEVDPSAADRPSIDAQQRRVERGRGGEIADLKDHAEESRPG